MLFWFPESLLAENVYSCQLQLMEWQMLPQFWKSFHRSLAKFHHKEDIMHLSATEIYQVAHEAKWL